MTTMSLLEPQLVETAREVVRDKTCIVVHDATGFKMAYSPVELAMMQRDGTINEAIKPILLDYESANMLVELYDALSDDNRIKFDSMLKKHGCAAFIAKIWSLSI